MTYCALTNTHLNLETHFLQRCIWENRSDFHICTINMKPATAAELVDLALTKLCTWTTHDNTFVPHLWTTDSSVHLNWKQSYDCRRKLTPTLGKYASEIQNQTWKSFKKNRIEFHEEELSLYGFFKTCKKLCICPAVISLGELCACANKCENSSDHKFWSVYTIFSTQGEPFNNAREKCVYSAQLPQQLHQQQSPAPVMRFKLPTSPKPRMKMMILKNDGNT